MASTLELNLIDIKLVYLLLYRMLCKFAILVYMTMLMSKYTSLILIRLFRTCIAHAAHQNWVKVDWIRVNSGHIITHHKTHLRK